MKFTFPDSGRTIEMDGISFLSIAQIRGYFEKNYPGKPVYPKDPLEEHPDQTPTREEMEAYQKAKESYETAYNLWQERMRNAQWAAIKAYYASCVKPESVVKEDVQRAIDSVKNYVNLPEAILAGYESLGVPFDPSLMERYIYLFHVCISNSSEQVLFENAIGNGSTPTRELVEQMFFRLRTKV